jgi:hypothetical protein
VLLALVAIVANSEGGLLPWKEKLKRWKYSKTT